MPRQVHSVNIKNPLIGAPLLLLTACAAGQTTRQLGGDVQVRTLRHSWTNAHLVTHGAAAFLVDAGLERDAPALDADLRAAGIDPAALSLIVLTHGHADHAGGAGWFQRRYGTRVVLGRGDEALTAAGHNDPLCPTNDDARDRLEADSAETFTPFAPTVVVDEALDLEALTGVSARAVRLPGHTGGSLVVLLPDAALVGDLFRGDVFTSATRTHFYMCDLDDNRRDVTALLEQLAPKAAVFFPGHFGPLERSSVERAFPHPEAP